MLKQKAAIIKDSVHAVFLHTISCITCIHYNGPKSTTIDLQKKENATFHEQNMAQKVC